MRKRILILLLLAALILPTVLAGCARKEKIHIVFLGDSIAEGIAGMRPVSERERDAYYGVLGIRNGYDFKNRAISGSRSRDLLRRLKEEDKGIRMAQTLVRTADIVHVSILGNDLLLADIGRLITSTAAGDYTYINEIVATAATNIAGIVETIKDYNPDALFIIQLVYNPIFENSTLITAKARADLEELDVYPEDYRRLADELVSMVNKVVYDYLDEHPGAFYIVDMQKEYNRILAENPERGKAMIFVDDAHPSSEGHAVMADMNQKILEATGYANPKTALKNYKKMRIEQLNRLYSETVNVKSVKKQINKAKSCEEVTEIYYAAIKDKMPDYY